MQCVSCSLFVCRTDARRPFGRAAGHALVFRWHRYAAPTRVLYVALLRAGDVDQAPHAGLALLRLLEQRVGGQISLDREYRPE